MNLSLTSYLILIPAIFMAGIIDAVCGGGGLLTLPAYLLAGFPGHLAIGTNTASTVCGGAASLWRFARDGKVHWPSMITAAPMAAAGAFIGARLYLVLSDRSLEIVLMMLLPVIAVVVLIKRDFGVENRLDSLSRRSVFIRAAAIGLVVSAYNGFYGAGAGTFYIIGFTALERMDLICASGSTKFCSLGAVLVATVTYAFSGTVLWPMVFVGSFFSAAGNLVGSSLALRGGARVIKPVFVAVLALLFLRLLLGSVF